MTADLGTVTLTAGQTVVVSGPAPLASHANSGHTRVRVTAPGDYVPPPPPAPVLPPGAYVVGTYESIASVLANGFRLLYLRTGVHRFALGSQPTKYRDVSILAYPGDSPVIDGTGLDPHLVYLDVDSGTWTLGVPFRGFHPVDSGVVGVGDGCRLVTVKGFGGVGMGRAGKPYESGSHALYFHGTGTGIITDADLRGFPGAAIHAYRGSPIVSVVRGSFGAFYESALIYSGNFTFEGSAFVEPAAAYDVQVGGDSTGRGSATLTGCTGTGPNGTVRRVG